MRDFMQPIEPTPPERRDARKLLSFVLGGLATLALAVPLLGYYLGPMIRRKADEWIDLGLAADFPEGQTRMVSYTNPNTVPWDGLTAKAAAYVRRESGQN